MSSTEAEVLLALPDRGYRRVSLAHELRQPRTVPFARSGEQWELRWPRPAADRVEYLLEVEDRNGNVERIADPGNPARAAGVFGEKSVLELPGYEPPA